MVGEKPKKLYLVTTPEYGVKMVLLDDGTGPTEWGCDAMQVLAHNKREAVQTAVRLWVKGIDPEWKSSWGRKPRGYCERQKDDGLCPWTGIRAEELNYVEAA